VNKDSDDRARLVSAWMIALGAALKAKVEIQILKKSDEEPR
jgi:hypothetical protein